MKATGIVRKVDELGRIVMPVDIRRDLEINIKDDVEIFTEGQSIVLKKHIPECVFCGSVDDVSDVKGKKICKSCIDNIRK